MSVLRWPSYLLKILLFTAKGCSCLGGKCDENMINDHGDFRLKPGVSEEKEKCVAS